ncbi:hypothetical protein [Winogradskyella sp. PE311]|uniref:hypothetical protein n=1 Tax=Winogradskyella sp. PE311 TaxID=3366943 RepID=UPI00398137F0
MHNTISKSSWINDVLTTENEVDKKILSKYTKYYASVTERNNLLAKNDYWFHIFDNNFDENEHFEKLLSFKYPIKEANFNFHNKNNYAKAITKLKGYVSEIKDEYFVAKLEELDNSDTYEIGEFDLSDVDKGDIELLEVGSVFYWNFGYHVDRGQVKKMSEIRFQRISNLDINEFDSICEESDKLNDSLDWD